MTASSALRVIRTEPEAFTGLRGEADGDLAALWRRELEGVGEVVVEDLPESGALTPQALVGQNGVTDAVVDVVGFFQ
jgi:hypothetical protein